VSGQHQGTVLMVVDPNPHDRIEGWKAIADALKVSERTAKRLASPKRKFRLPVRQNWRGVYVTRWNLHRWQEDNDYAYGVNVED